MNYFVIVTSGNDCDRFRNFYVGEASDIARYLLDETEDAINGYRDGMTLKECEDWYHCDFDDYRKLKRRKKHFPEELIRNYCFEMSDMWISTSYFASQPKEVENLINDFLCNNDLEYKLKNTPLAEADVSEAFYELETIYNNDFQELKHFTTK